jgi:hypothetical protein
MRATYLSLFTAGIFTLVNAAAQTGVTPRPSASDYPVHRTTKTATFAAAIVPPEQIKKIFPGDIVKKYAVVEVAVYPQDGYTVNIDSLDFALKLASDEMSHPITPREVASIWDEKNAPTIGNKVDVTTETGVVYTSGNDPVYGRSHGWGTYTGVGVGVPGQPAPPPPSYDPRVVEAKARARALPEGRTAKAVAGYLYFPVPVKKHKNNPIALEYLRDAALLDLPFPPK